MGKWFLLGVSFAFSLGICAAPGAAQSLGDLAKKNAEKKAADKDRTKPLAKTYSDKDLTPDPTAPATSQPSSATKAEEDTAATTPAEKPAGDKDEAYWRGRMRPLLEQLAADGKMQDSVAGKLHDTNSKMQPNLPSLAVFGPEVVRLTNELKDWNTKVEEDLRAIETLKEEGRRAGALPGWFR